MWAGLCPDQLTASLPRRVPPSEYAQPSFVRWKKQSLHHFVSSDPRRLLRLRCFFFLLFKSIQFTLRFLQMRNVRFGWNVILWYFLWWCGLAILQNYFLLFFGAAGCICCSSFFFYIFGNPNKASNANHHDGRLSQFLFSHIHSVALLLVEPHVWAKMRQNICTSLMLLIVSLSILYLYLKKNRVVFCLCSQKASTRGETPIKSVVSCFIPSLVATFNVTQSV